jgi:hypothetical protein
MGVKANRIKEVETVVASPEKAGVGGSIPVLQSSAGGHLDLREEHRSGDEVRGGSPPSKHFRYNHPSSS